MARESIFLAIVREAAAGDQTLRDIQRQFMRIQRGTSGPVDVEALEIRNALRQHTLHYAVLDLLRHMLPRQELDLCPSYSSGDSDMPSLCDSSS